MQKSNFTDNKKFWNTVKPLFSNSGGGSQKITLVKDDKIISSDKEVAETFNDFFKNSVKSLNISENNCLKTDTKNLTDPIKIAIKKFEKHPSIIDIKEMADLGTEFSFSKVNAYDIELELKSLKTNKATTFLNISGKQLKQFSEVIVDPLMNIWNIEIIENKKKSSALKLADLTTILKKLESISVKNYRPVLAYYQ